MILNEVFERFVEESPVSVMARAVLENALTPTAVDALFEGTAERQYTRELLFSDVVDLMGKHLNGTGKVGIESGGPNATNLNAWVDAIKSTMAKKYPNVQIVDVSLSPKLANVLQVPGDRGLIDIQLMRDMG